MAAQNEIRRLTMNRDSCRRPFMVRGTTNTLRASAEKPSGKPASAASHNQLARQMQFRSSTIAELPAGHDRTVHDEHS
ncbi:hypothetical protein PLANPX_5538 [Lacipirellula parvula]|uniref:Uncharacterized protein n=1 Tax=Lacipirellula parvula TaxID=2650471 RepID=A0A5K7XMC0_9BACT|nr:hypothetical protein PLANPX_5538 [Lacipirellula parvula]